MERPFILVLMLKYVHRFFMVHTASSLEDLYIFVLYEQNLKIYTTSSLRFDNVYILKHNLISIVALNSNFSVHSKATIAVFISAQYTIQGPFYDFN